MNAPAPTGYLQLLREHPGYRRFYLAHAFSLLGDWFNLIAIMTLLGELTGSSAQALGTILVLKLLPIFVLGPVAGVVVDRVSRKGVMITADLLRSGVVLSLLLVTLYPHPAIIYLATALQIALSAFFEPARSASLPHLVPQKALATANALGAITWSAMFTLGAALGSAFTEAFGWQAAVVLDACTYLISALLIRGVSLPRRRQRPGRPTLAQMTGVPDFMEGLRYILAHRRVAWLVGVKAAWGIAGAFTLLLTLFGSREYALDGRAALGISLLYTARAVGTGLGPVLGRRLTGNDTGAMARLIGWSFFWGAGWYLVFAMVDHIALAVLCVTIAHLGGSALWVFSTVLLQHEVPDRFRGRVFAAELGLMTLTTSLSTLLYGYLADSGALSLRGIIVILSLSLLPPGMAWLWSTRSWFTPQHSVDPHRRPPV